MKLTAASQLVFFAPTTRRLSSSSSSSASPTNGGVLSDRFYCMCWRIFVFPLSSLPHSPPNQFLVELLHYSMETA